jgi:copper chaperone CopZ
MFVFSPAPVMPAASALPVTAHAPLGEGRGDESHRGDNIHVSDTFLQRQYKGNLTLMNMVINFELVMKQECAADILKRKKTMSKQTFSIPNISCGHCVMSIKNELSELDGVKKVEGDPGAKNVTVEWEAPVTEEKIKATLKEINYPAA